MNGTAPSGLTATVSPWQEELHQQGPGTCWRDAGAQPTSPGTVLGRLISLAAALRPGAASPTRAKGSARCRAGTIPLDAREQSSSTDRDLRRVADMPEAASTRPRSALSLNSDGQRHPLENSLA